MNRKQSIIPAVARGKHDKDQRQTCLIEAGTQVFAARGFDAATTREVAERAGCSEGLIHRYFGGKRGLLLAILADKADEVTAMSAETLPPCDTVNEEIDQMLTSALDIYWGKRDFMRVCVSQSAIDEQTGHVIGEQVNGNKVRFYTERLRHHQQLGRIRGDADVAAVAFGLAGLNLSTGFFGQVAFAMNRKDLRANVLEIARVISRGLVSDGGAAHVSEVPPTIIERAGRRAPGAQRDRTQHVASDAAVAPKGSGAQ